MALRLLLALTLGLVVGPSHATSAYRQLHTYCETYLWSRDPEPFISHARSLETHLLLDRYSEVIWRLRDSGRNGKSWSEMSQEAALTLELKSLSVELVKRKPTMEAKDRNRLALLIQAFGPIRDDLQ